MAKKNKDDPAIIKVRSLFKESGLSLQQFGEKMGYDPEQARQSAFQFMKSNDPHISMLRKAAAAFGIDITEITRI